MGVGRLERDLRDGKFDANAPLRAFEVDDGSGNLGWALVVTDTALSNGESGYAKAAIAIDVNNKTIKYNNGTATSTTWANIDTSASVDLDGAFDNGKVIDGATSQANAARIGDGTDYIGIYALSAGNTAHVEANSGSTIELDPDAGSGSGTVNCNGLLVVDGNMTASGDLAVTGTLTAGTFTVTSLALSTITTNCTVQAGSTFTVAGTAGSTVFDVTAGDATIQDGSLAITDADNATTFSITNNTITSGALIDITSTSLSTGTGLRMTADGLTSGTMVLLDSTVAGWSGGFYLRAFDGAANDLTIGQYGAVTIAGNGSTDVLTITTGDVQIDDGKLEIDTDEDDTTYVKRNQGTVTGPVVEIEATNTGDDQALLLLDHNGTGAAPCVTIDHEGTADCVTITTLAAGASALKITTEATTGVGIELVGTASQTTSMQNITNGGTGATGWLGASNVGQLHITNDGNLAHANASCLYIAYSGTGAATGLGTSIRVIDTGATATSYAVYINAATGEALDVAQGIARFAESVSLTTGITFGTSGSTITQDATNDYWDAGAANETIHIGNTTATDFRFHGSGAAGEDCLWDASGSSLSFPGGSALVLPQGTGSGGSGRQDVTGSIFYETDAKKIWIYDGAGWVGVAVT